MLPYTAPERIAELLAELARVHHWFGLYAPGHPFLEGRIHALRDALAAQASEEPSGILLFGIVKDRAIYRDGFIGGEQPLLSGFPEMLSRLHVSTLGIGSDVTVDGLSDFFRMLRDLRATTSDDPGGERIFREGIRGIHLSPVNYKEVLSRGVTRLDEAPSSAVSPEGRAAAAPFGGKPVARKGMAVLLELFLLETRTPEFLDLLSAITNAIPALLLERDFEMLERALSALSSASGAGSPERQAAAAKALAGVNFHRIIEACLSDPVNLQKGHGGVELLVKFGEVSADALLDRLLVEEGAARRKALLSLVVRLGSVAVAPILARLSRSSWFYIRNLCLLLGEIGDPAGVPALVRMMSHGETKIRREAIQSLGKIRTPDPDAIAALGKTLLYEPLFSSSREDPVRIDAANALSRIGGTEAVAFLHIGKSSRKKAVREQCEALLRTRGTE